MRRLFTLLLLVFSLTILIPAAAGAEHKDSHRPPGQEQSEKPGNDEKGRENRNPVTICHWTPSGYVQITVDDDAWQEHGAGHGQHEHDVLVDENGECPEESVEVISPPPTSTPAPESTATESPTEEAVTAPTEPTEEKTEFVELTEEEKQEIREARTELAYTGAEHVWMLLSALALLGAGWFLLRRPKVN